MTSVQIKNHGNGEVLYIGSWPYPVDLNSRISLFEVEYEIVSRVLNPHKDRLYLSVRPIHREMITIDGITVYLDTLTKEEREALINSRNMTW